MRLRPGVELANLTDIGCRRERNEDYYAYFEPEDEEAFLRKGRLLAISDGMGGHSGGEVASGLAIEALRETFLSANGADPATILQEALSRAHHDILAAGEAHPELNGMGTTCTAAIVQRGSLSYAHIGDSRLYLVRGGVARQLTEDQTLVNKLVRDGLITEEQAATHEERNVLTAALGMSGTGVAAEVSSKPIPLQAGDAVILTTDGLHGVVTGDEIAAAVSQQAPYEACRTLVNLAKERGGPDNITLQILEIQELG